MPKNIFIAATGKDIGKSTISFALIDKYLSEEKKVGFMKPLGQRWIDSPWGKVEEDVVLMKKIFGLHEDPRDMNPIVVQKGFTEEYLSKMIRPDLKSKIINSYQKIAQDKDYVIIEGTGHSGVGSVLDKSNPEVARILNAQVVLAVDGGIGSSIDKLELNRTFFESVGIKVSGVIVNKVLETKAAKVEKYIKQYCKNKNLKYYGLIPYSPILSHPTLGQVIEELEPEIIHETGERKTVIDSFVVGASTTAEFIEFMQEKRGNILLVFPAVRLDLILAIPNLINFTKSEGLRILTVLFSGKHRPSPGAVKTLIENDVNVLWEGGETFTVISGLSNISIKTRPEDSTKIEEIKERVKKNINFNQLEENITISRPAMSLMATIKTYLRTAWSEIKNAFEKIKSFFKQFQK